MCFLKSIARSGVELGAGHSSTGPKHIARLSIVILFLSQWAATLRRWFRRSAMVSWNGIMGKKWKWNLFNGNTIWESCMWTVLLCGCQHWNVVWERSYSVAVKLGMVTVLTCASQTWNIVWQLSYCQAVKPGMLYGNYPNMWQWNLNVVQQLFYCVASRCSHMSL